MRSRGLLEMRPLVPFYYISGSLNVCFQREISVAAKFGVFGWPLLLAQCFF